MFIAFLNNIYIMLLYVRCTCS